MKHDEKILELVKNLKGDCTLFIDTVKSYGNQCASTDRVLEGLLETADQIKTLFNEEFGEEQPKVFNHIEDCWSALEKCESVDEIEELFKKFPRWSGSWDWYYDNGDFCVRNDCYDETHDLEDYEIREIENLSCEAAEVYWEIIFNEKENNEDRTLHYNNFDDAKADYKLFTEQEPEFYNYVVLKEVNYYENGDVEYKDIEAYKNFGELDGEDGKEVK